MAGSPLAQLPLQRPQLPVLLRVDNLERLEVLREHPLRLRWCHATDSGRVQQQRVGRKLEGAQLERL